MTDRIQALLLIGPTGSGKTPLGDFLEQTGIEGPRCLHFDFGYNLRAAAEGALAGITDEETGFIREVISDGALLENETFYLARNILTSYLTARSYSPGDILLLNGLPRHRGQAESMGTLVRVETVVSLSCSPETVYERIRLNTGGDRTQRDDDQIELIRKKIAVFNERTLPLVDYYRSKGAETAFLEVEVNTVPRDLARSIQGKQL